MAKTFAQSALARSREEPTRFEDFYRERAEAVLLYLTRRTLDPHVALELTAETFAIAFEKRRQFRGATDDEAGAWLFRIAQRELAEFFRKGDVQRRAVKRLGISEGHLSDDDVAYIVERAELDDVRRAVGGCFEQLPANQRQAVQLRVLDELPYDEVARLMGTSEQTARSRVSRGLRELRAVLEPKGVAT